MQYVKIRGQRRHRKRKRKRAPAMVFGALCLLLAGILFAELINNIETGVWPAFHRTDQIPESLLAFKEKYPECAEFVDSYPENKDKTYVIDLSGEVQQGTIPLFLQWDERWGYEQYGDDFFAATACGPTSLSMVLCGLSGNTTWNPLEVAKFSEQQGYFVEGIGTSWDLMTTGAQMLGLTSIPGDISEEFIFDALYSGKPVICSMYPGDFTFTGHFIVLTGVDENGKIILNDCNSRIRSETHWDIDVLLPQIRSLWAYENTW